MFKLTSMYSSNLKQMYKQTHIIVLSVLLVVSAACIRRKPTVKNPEVPVQESLVLSPENNNLEDNNYEIYTQAESSNLLKSDSNKINYPSFKDEARLLDIPFSINAGPPLDLGNFEEDQRKVIIKFIINQSLEEIINFYRAEMECLGWYETAVIKGAETCLLFQKPSRLCVINIRSSSDNNSYEILLFIAPNKFLV